VHLAASSFGPYEAFASIKTFFKPLAGAAGSKRPAAGGAAAGAAAAGAGNAAAAPVRHEEQQQLGQQLGQQQQQADRQPKRRRLDFDGLEELDTAEAAGAEQQQGAVKAADAANQPLPAASQLLPRQQKVGAEVAPAAGGAGAAAGAAGGPPAAPAVILLPRGTVQLSLTSTLRGLASGQLHSGEALQRLRQGLQLSGLELGLDHSGGGSG
jgi:hypothetical protein